jgi:predicted RNA-binding protein with PUA-like domain
MNRAMQNYSWSRRAQSITPLQEHAMANWLFKSDPDTYGLAELEKEKRTVWDGVGNPVALKNLRGCKKGDRVFIYHTGGEKTIVGIAEVVKDGPDPEIKFVKKLSRGVTLAEIKAKKEFADFALARLPRLSVMPVTDAQWNAIIKMI